MDLAAARQALREAADAVNRAQDALEQAQREYADALTVRDALFVVYADLRTSILAEQRAAED